MGPYLAPSCSHTLKPQSPHSHTPMVAYIPVHLCATVSRTHAYAPPQQSIHVYHNSKAYIRTNTAKNTYVQTQPSIYTQQYSKKCMRTNLCKSTYVPTQPSIHTHQHRKAHIHTAKHTYAPTQQKNMHTHQHRKAYIRTNAAKKYRV